MFNAIVRFFAERGFTLDRYANSLHLFLSFALVITLVALNVNLFTAAAIVFGIGIVKELVDKYIRHREFSWQDLVWDMLGVVIAMFMCLGSVGNKNL
jgi:VanZ family protein